MIPEGEFAAELVDIGLQPIEVGKAPSIGVQFKFLEKPVEGQRIIDYWSLSPTAAPYSKEKLLRCGWQSGTLRDFSGMEGNKVSLKIKHKTFEGKTYARIAFVNVLRTIKKGDIPTDLLEDLDGQLASIETETEARAIAASGAAKSAAVKANGAGDAAAAGQGEPPPLSDDDIPF